MVRFIKADVAFDFRHAKRYKRWLESAALLHGQSIEELNIVFCSDNYLLALNKEFLSHDYFTDVITFDYSRPGVLNGEIYISIPRVRENAKTFSQSTRVELARVMIHGLLHLVGFNDKSEDQRLVMRNEENRLLALLVE